MVVLIHHIGCVAYSVAVLVGAVVVAPEVAAGAIVPEVVRGRNVRVCLAGVVDEVVVEQARVTEATHVDSIEAVGHVVT